MRYLLLCAGMLALAGCDWEDFGSSTQYTADFHYNYPLKKGGTISLENFNGSVEIAGWDQDTVDISGVKYGATPEARDAVRIDIVPSPDSIAIRTIRPSERRNVGARYVLRVPRRAQLDRITTSNGAMRINSVDGPVRLKTSNGSLKVFNVNGNIDGGTSNGSVELENINGDCTVRTSNGRVKAQAVRGAFAASTSNGSVDAALDDLKPSGVRIGTSNGAITLRLARTVNARLMARTSNSSISTDFDVARSGTSSKHHLEGTIGTGGPVLDLSTSNGGIHVVRQ
jgi:Putative adhesin